MTAIYIVPSHPCPPDWKIAMQQLALGAKTPLRKCVHKGCGVLFQSADKKRYHCSDACKIKAAAAKRLSNRNSYVKRKAKTK